MPSSPLQRCLYICIPIGPSLAMARWASSACILCLALSGRVEQSLQVFLDRWLGLTGCVAILISGQIEFSDDDDGLARKIRSNLPLGWFENEASWADFLCWTVEGLKMLLVLVAVCRALVTAVSTSRSACAPHLMWKALDSWSDRTNLYTQP